MRCRMCGCDKKLIQAHIIPRSFHRIEPGEVQPTRLITNVKGRYAQKIPKGVYDGSILCEECEPLFTAWDDYGDDIFIKSWDRFEKLFYKGEAIGFGLPAYDYHKLKMFFLSVLWRISTSSHVMFKGVNLGRREPVLRQAILSNEPGDGNFFGVVLQAFDTVNVGFLNPGTDRFSGIRSCRIYMSQIIAFIKVDSRPFDEPFGSAALAPVGL